MRLLADMHVSPRTVDFLRSVGHDVLRVTEVLPPTAADQTIIARAIEDNRVILTQDLDFSAAIALAGRGVPSLISLRLSSSRIEHVNDVLERTLPAIERDVEEGMIVAVEDHRIRRRRLPIS